MRALHYLIWTIAVLCATPAAIGVVDAWAWLVTGSQISWIEWGPLRPVTAAFFLAVTAILVGAILNDGKQQ